MTLRNLFLVAGLLCLLPAFLSGCGRNDAAQYSSYSELPAEDGSARPATSDPGPDEEDATSGGHTSGVQPATTEDVATTATDSALPGTTDAEVAIARTDSGNSSPVAPEPSLPGDVTASGSDTPDVSAAEPEESAEGVDPASPPEADAIASATTTPSDPQQPAVPGDPAAQATDDKPAEPRKVKVLVKSREFKEEGPEGAIRISFDDFDLLKVLNMDPVTANAAELMPKWLKDLDGKRVRVRGFMYPPFEETNLPFFVLARDNQICCFGRNPKIYDLVEVFMRKGVTTDYIQNRPFDVVGIFRINPAAEEGLLYQLYQLEDATVIEQH